MPCYTVNTVRLNEKVYKFRYIADAVKELGGTVFHSSKERQLVSASVNGVQLTFSKGEIKLQSSMMNRIEQVKSQFNQAYSRGIVKRAAKMTGWKVQTVVGKPNVLKLKK